MIPALASITAKQSTIIFGYTVFGIPKGSEVLAGHRDLSWLVLLHPVWVQETEPSNISSLRLQQERRQVSKVKVFSWQALLRGTGKDRRTLCCSKIQEDSTAVMLYLIYCASTAQGCSSFCNNTGKKKQNKSNFELWHRLASYRSKKSSYERR